MKRSDIIHYRNPYLFLTKIQWDHEIDVIITQSRARPLHRRCNHAPTRPCCKSFTGKAATLQLKLSLEILNTFNDSIFKVYKITGRGKILRFVAELNQIYFCFYWVSYVNTSVGKQ